MGAGRHHDASRGAVFCLQTPRSAVSSARSSFPDGTPPSAHRVHPPHKLNGDKYMRRFLSITCLAGACALMAAGQATAQAQPQLDTRISLDLLTSSVDGEAA